jgi:hypothetical protein
MGFAWALGMTAMDLRDEWLLRNVYIEIFTSKIMNWSSVCVRNIPSKGKRE